jgi:hypothetical protein
MTGIAGRRLSRAMQYQLCDVSREPEAGFEPAWTKSSPRYKGGAISQAMRFRRSAEGRSRLTPVPARCDHPRPSLYPRDCRNGLGAIPSDIAVDHAQQTIPCL